MSKFVGVYRELASFTELLNTQVELMLVERLHHNWLKVINRPTLLLTHFHSFHCILKVRGRGPAVAHRTGCCFLAWKHMSIWRATNPS